MKVRHTNINDHLTSEANVDAFTSLMTNMVAIYNTCPDASRIRFIQAIEDQFKANSQARARSVSGSSGGTGWRDTQKASFSGRGAKWIKLTGPLFDLLKVTLGTFEKDGEDVEDYRKWTESAGYGWVRYSGPRGTEDAQELAFEVRITGSRIDHPKHLLRITAQLWEQLEENRSGLGGTPFSMKLED